MAFAYFNRLTRPQQRIYLQSDSVTTIPLRGASEFHTLVDDLREALASEDQLRIQGATERLVNTLTAALDVVRVRVEVLAARPSRSWGELHGLYTTGGRGRSAKLTVWMRTARHRKVVAFKTFLRTILHECCHHLDYERLRLADSFHTQGFYKRESSLFHQLTNTSRSP